MKIAVDVLVGFVALSHLWFLILEMFLWRKPLGLKAFRNTQERADATWVLAANQGLYNGFLVAGLIWSIMATDASQAHSLKVFFLSCVSVAGIYGAWTVAPVVFFLQGLPALIALAITLSV